MKHKIKSSSILIASCVLAGGCCSEHGRGGAGYSSYRTTAPAPTATAAPEYTAPAPSETSQAVSGSQVVIPLYKEQVNVGKQEVDAGTVHLRKVVRTETINQPLELKRETVTIQRDNSQVSGAEAGKPFQEQDFTIQLKREEPMIQTQVIQSGRVIAQKQQQSEQTTVQREVRHEDIAVDKGNAQGVNISEGVGAATTPGGESAAAAAGPITDIGMLTSAGDPAALAGKQVQLYNVKIHEVVSPSVICVSDAGGQKVYAHLQQPNDSLKAGDKVNLTGTVKQPSQATDITGAVGGEASQKLSSQPVFIEAPAAQSSQ